MTIGSTCGCSIQVGRWYPVGASLSSFATLPAKCALLIADSGVK
jgi:hypothetical protein